MSTVSVNVRYIVPPVPKYSSFPKPNQSTVSVSLDASDVVRSLRSKLVRGWTFQIIVNGQAKVDGDTIASPESAVYIAVVNGQAEVKESSAGKPASAITTEAKSASSTSKATKGLRFSTAAKVLSALQRGKVRGRSAAGQAKPATSTSKATKGIKFSTAAKVLSALQRGKVRGVAEREETGDKKSDSAAYKDAAEEFLKSVQDADDEEGLQEILDELDGDGDGCISFDEFVRFLKQKVGRSSSYAVEEAQRAWLKIDKNGDLKLTFKEFKAHWKSMVVSANEDALSESAETSNDALEADALKEVRKSLSEARRLRLSTLSMLSNAGLSASNEDMVAYFDELARTEKTLQGLLAQAKQLVAQADAQFE